MSELLRFLWIALKDPLVLKSYRHIYLLSHMRANTSVLGHVLGSHPEIEGYYELHIGYYSWKSKFRQKLKYFSDHRRKGTARYLFDKVLHNEHQFNMEVVNREKDIVIISLREPHSTIKSIMKLYDSIDPNHEFNSIQGATKYYIERLKHLEQFAVANKGMYYYFNADDLTAQPDETLKTLTGWLGLSSKLSKTYQKFKKTGAQGAGDSSENMEKGEIVVKSRNYTQLSGLPENIDDVFLFTQETLSKFSKTSHA